MQKKKVFIGIDVSKETLDVALTNDVGQVIYIGKFKNSKMGFIKIVDKLKRYSADEYLICIESTGKLGYKLIDYVHNQRNMKIAVVNPYYIKAFSNSLGSRTKNDKIDSKIIAMYCIQYKEIINFLEPRTEEFKKLKELIRHKQYLIRQLANQKTYLKSVIDKDIKKSQEKIILKIEKEIKIIDEKIEELLNKSDDISKEISLLESVPGIGRKTASQLLVELLPQQGKYTKKAQTAHARLAPSEHSSGTSVRKKTKCCILGTPIIKTTLYFPTMNAIRNNPIVASFYKKLISKGKPKMVALIACTRKLLPNNYSSCATFFEVGYYE